MTSPLRDSLIILESYPHPNTYSENEYEIPNLEGGIPILDQPLESPYEAPTPPHEETFSPTGKWATIRTLLSLAAQKGWKVHQMDVKIAFLNEVLKQNVFMSQP